jgi:hypothetical protein
MCGSLFILKGKTANARQHLSPGEPLRVTGENPHISLGIYQKLVFLGLIPRWVCFSREEFLGKVFFFLWEDRSLFS